MITPPISFSSSSTQLLHISQDFHSLSSLRETQFLLSGSDEYIWEHTQDYWASRISATLAEISDFEISEPSGRCNHDILHEIRERYFGMKFPQSSRSS
jgi:hypothetical protein